LSLNTPTRPLEASGTSGEKAVLNGTMHFSVLDGWWVEGYKPDAGWALTESRAYSNQDYQNEFDAETIYYILENEIIPIYYDRNKNGIPKAWVKIIKNTISEIAPHFTMKRMLNDYMDKYYKKLFERKNKLFENEFKIAKDIALWKKSILRKWDHIEVVSLSLPGNLKQSIKMGEKYYGEIVLDLKGLSPQEVGIEFVMVNSKDDKLKLIHKQEYNFFKNINNKFLYSINLTPNFPGAFQFGIRIFPKNNELPNHHDLNLVKWV